MARNLVKSMSIDVCADCSQIDAPWVSVNRGVLLCDGCCSVHLSLGRHVSQIKHLKKGSWCPQQLKMVQQLVASGANNIWEYTLVDPVQNRSNKKKPSPKDPIHPTKAEFIKAKYQLLTYVNKPKDENLDIEDYSKQLHSSVRTNNLETSLRLLALGADSNYFYPDKGTSVLHVAAYSNQPLQVELLLVYGADPSYLDNSGKTPLDLARNNGYNELAERLVECQYELTDGLAYYLCKRKPDHNAGIHFIKLEVSDGLDLSETAKGAKKKLQALPNHLFEELALDVYGEADRRENVEIWLSTQTGTSPVPSEKQVVPFLPSNPDFSATRNQGRQKLAKFNKREFTTLIIDILNDAKRRYCSVTSIIPSPNSEKNDKQLNSFNNIKNTTNNDKNINSNNKLTTEQIYDQVYTESDYALIGEGLCAQIESLSVSSVSQSTAIIAFNPACHNNDKITNPSSSSSSKSNSTDETAVLKRSLQESQQQSQNLRVELERYKLKCQQLSDEVSVLKTTIEKLKHENHVYKSFVNKFDPTSGNNSIPLGNLEGEVSNHVRWTVMENPQRQFDIKSDAPEGDFPSPPQDLLVTSRSVDFEGKDLSSRQSQQNWQSVEGRTSNVRPPIQMFSTPGMGSVVAPVSSGVPVLMSESSVKRFSDEMKSSGAEGKTMPTQEEVVRKTERITKALQELFQMAQDNKFEVYSKCSGRIQTAVSEMMRLFPPVVNSQGQLEALRALEDGSEKIKVLCEAKGLSEEAEMKTHTQKIIHTAYDIAKAAKQLVMSYE